VIQVTAAGFMPNEQVSLALAAPSATPFALDATIQLFQAASNGTLTGVQYIVPKIAPGTYLLLALGQRSRVLRSMSLTVLSSLPSPAATPHDTSVWPTSTQAPVPSLPTADMSATTSYFADGYTGTAAVDGKVTFTERLFFYNHSSMSSRVSTTYDVYNPANESRTVVTKQDTVAAGATVSRLVNQDVGNDRMVSATVKVSAGVAAQEVITRTRSDGTPLEAGSSVGSTHLAITWYLAEGYIGESLQEYITLYNPSSTLAHAQIHYLPDGTAAPAPVSVPVPAQGQVTINMRSQYNQLLPKGSKNVAAQITADLPIAVDRAMYWGDGSGSAKYGYARSPAIAAGLRSQYLALLPTSGGSQSFVTVLNPNDGTATTSLRLLNASGNTLKTVAVSIGGHTRHTFMVNSILSGDNRNVSAGLLSSSMPVVAEAALYYGGSPNVGRHPGKLMQGSASAQPRAGAVAGTAN
jgi:hypothetical protein